jgi:hypothetical protein
VVDKEKGDEPCSESGSKPPQPRLSILDSSWSGSAGAQEDAPYQAKSAAPAAAGPKGSRTEHSVPAKKPESVAHGGARPKVSDSAIPLTGDYAQALTQGQQSSSESAGRLPVPPEGARDFAPVFRPCGRYGTTGFSYHVPCSQGFGMDIDDTGDVISMMDRGGPAWFRIMEQAWVARASEATRLRADRNKIRAELEALKLKMASTNEFMASLKAKCNTSESKLSQRVRDLTTTVQDQAGTIERLSAELKSSARALNSAKETIAAGNADHQKELADRDRMVKDVEEHGCKLLDSLDAQTRRTAEAE